MMRNSIDQFNLNITSTRQLGSVYTHLVDNLRSQLELSDLLRAQIVYAVSALDRLVHDIVRIGMIEIYEGKRKETSKYLSFQISNNTLKKMQESVLLQTTPFPIEPPAFWLEQEIIIKHKLLSFQDPNNISDALAIIWEDHRWQNISNKMGSNQGFVKTYLINIVQRRNKIVHEADINISDGKKNIIDKDEVLEIIEFINNVGNSIFECVKLP